MDLNAEVQSKKNHVLLAVTGMTPQVVTETLFGLMVQRGIMIDEVCVITTAEGKRALLGEAGLPSLEEELNRMCKVWNVHIPAFDPKRSLFIAREETLELHDVRTDRDNILFPNLITNVVRRYTADANNVLHCSIAGGRKTMSVAMAFALSLFGRRDDTLYHVLVSPEFEASKKFFPETTEEGSQLILAEVPYIRLREKLPLLEEYPHASFSDLVAIAQGVVDQMMYLPQLVFERNTHTVIIGDQRIMFRPFDFAFYLFCAKRKAPVPAGKSFGDANWKKLWRLYERLSPSYGHRERVRKSFSSAQRDALLTKSASTIRRTLAQALGKGVARYYAVTSIGQYGDVRYTILLDRSKIEVR
ncbi:MAG: CRISPR-associated ring nuclease Csm6 [Bacteroidota bacterium]